MARSRLAQKQEDRAVQFRPRRKVNTVYPGFMKQRDRIRAGKKRKSPHRLLAFSVLVSVFFLIGFSYLLSSGRPIFGPSIRDVDSRDFFYSQYMDDEARESVSGAKGGPGNTPLKLFSYRIGKNDSLSRIAKKMGVSISSLISVNRLSDAHMLRVGQKLVIPNQKGVYYKVRKGDSVSRVAKRYKVSIDSIRLANGLINDEINKGEDLFIPGGKLSSWQMEKALGLIFRRPASGGWISSGFGYRRNPFTYRHQFHPGIDIALPYWSKIRAIKSGRVLFSGWRGGYGKLVVVRHSRGYSSRYGHMIRYVVRRGQWVRRGQLLGYVGSTGYSTGPHLHFELRRWGKLLNPFRVRGFRRAYRRGW